MSTLADFHSFFQKVLRVMASEVPQIAPPLTSSFFNLGVQSAPPHPCNIPFVVGFILRLPE